MVSGFRNKLSDIKIGYVYPASFVLNQEILKILSSGKYSFFNSEL